MHKTLVTSIFMGFLGLTACGDIGLSAGPTGTTDSSTTGATTSGSTTSTTSGTTTSGSTTSGTTTSGSTTSGTTTSGTTTSGTGASACTTSTETYASFGQAFVSANCIACHSNGGQPDLSTLAACQAQQASMLSQIMTGAMPLGATLSATDKTNAEAWLNCNPLP